MFSIKYPFYGILKTNPLKRIKTYVILFQIGPYSESMQTGSHTEGLPLPGKESESANNNLDFYMTKKAITAKIS